MAESPQQPAVSQPTPPSDEFVQLFTRHQRRVYLFILGQIPNPLDAEEVLQETNVVIWNKYQQFTPGTNFLAWACSVARYEILKFRDRRKRDRLLFSDEFLAMMECETVRRSELMDQRRDALVHCIGKLPPNDREIVQLRYTPGNTGQRVAELIGRPANSVYQSLGRIRRALLDCINRRLAAETPA